MIMIKVKQVEIIKNNKKQMIMIIIKEKYKVKGKTNDYITNDNKENNKDYANKSNNEQYRVKVEDVNESRGRKLYK